MDAFITRRGGGKLNNKLPQFTYEGGTYSVELSGGNWKIKFFTSGTFVSQRDILVDVFAVGAGGGGTQGSNQKFEGAGGGSGYTITEKAIPIYAGIPYEIVIGAGGAGSSFVSNTNLATAGNGGATSGFGVSADGGKGGKAGQFDTGGYDGKGGDGGSGGGVWSGAGGSDGSNGVVGNGAPSSGGGVNTAGKGQGTTTREFGESDGTLYANGGGSNTGTDGGNNTGDGGCSRNHNSTLPGGKGASGILIIRNARDVE